MTVSCKEESDHLMCVSRLKIAVGSSSTGAKVGLLFLSSEDLADPKYKEEMEKFDSWTLEDYQAVDRNGDEASERTPIALFEVDKER